MEQETMIGCDRFLVVSGRSTFSVNVGIIWEFNVRNCQDFGDCYGTRKPRKKRELLVDRAFLINGKETETGDSFDRFLGHVGNLGKPEKTLYFSSDNSGITVMRIPMETRKRLGGCVWLAIACARLSDLTKPDI